MAKEKDKAANKDKDRDMDRRVSPSVRIKGRVGVQSEKSLSPSYRLAAATNDTSPSPDSPTVPARPPFEGLRVLIVDESKKFVRHSTKHLQSLGCVVTEAKGCKQALRLLTTVRWSGPIRRGDRRLNSIYYPLSYHNNFY